MLYIVYRNNEVDDILDLTDKEALHFSRVNPDKELLPYDDLTNTDFTFDDGADFEGDLDC